MINVRKNVSSEMLNIVHRGLEWTLGIVRLDVRFPVAIGLYNILHTIEAGIEEA